jgi:hypothetical protein
MLMGKVMGALVVTRKVETMEGLKFLLDTPSSSSASARRLSRWPKSAIGWSVATSSSGFPKASSGPMFMPRSRAGWKW